MKAVSKDLLVCLEQLGMFNHRDKLRHGPLPIVSEFEEFTVLQSLLYEPGSYLREIHVQEELHDLTGSWISCPTFVVP